MSKIAKAVTPPQEPPEEEEDGVEPTSEEPGDDEQDRLDDEDEDDADDPPGTEDAHTQEDIPGWARTLSESVTSLSSRLENFMTSSQKPASSKPASSSKSLSRRSEKGADPVSRTKIVVQEKADELPAAPKTQKRSKRLGFRLK